mgnify:CR=1 FL=1|jgi:hypothetical protein
MTDNYINKITSLSYKRKLELINYLNIENELNKYTIEVFNGQPEKPQFCHFNDVDNNHDYNFRISRNIKTAQIIVKILKNNLSELDDYLKL